MTFRMLPQQDIPKVPSRRRPNPSLIVGASILGLLTLTALLVSFFPPHDPYASVGAPFLLPNGEFWLGTDHLGRDTFTRVVLASQTTLLISGCAALLGAVLGTGMGILAGYAGGIVDAVIMRAVDVLLSIPAILMALLIRVILGPGSLPLIISLGIILAPSFARVVRAPVLAMKNRDFVIAAEISGVHPARIALTHLLPNTLTPLLIQFAAAASSVVLLEAALSYLGQGVQAPDPSAGRMITESQRFIQIYPLLLAVPALLIILLSAAWNLLADGLQNYLSPRKESGLPGSRRIAARRIQRRSERSDTTAPTAAPSPAPSSNQ